MLSRSAFRAIAGVGVLTVAGAAALAGSAGAATGGTITASASRSLVIAAGANPITLSAHLVTTSPVLGANASYPLDTRYVTHDGGGVGTIPLTLTSGTTTNGVWSATLAPYLCSALWNVTFSAVTATTNLSQSVTVAVNQNLPDTTAPGAIQLGVGQSPLIGVGTPGATTAVSGTPGKPIEFTSSVQDTPTCGQTTSGVSSVVVTTHPANSATPSVSGSLHLAFDFTNPKYGLHWAGSLTLPANAPTGPWTYTAVATDNAGNKATLQPYFVTPTYPVG